MNQDQQIPKWKQVFEWVALTLVSIAVLDWLLDGRLRDRLPWKRRHADRPDTNAS